MDRRLELQEILENTLGSRNVYFQPPATVKLKYPCIIYHRSSLNQRYADNKTYLITPRYDITYISKTVDDLMVEKIAALPMCRYDRYYAADSLHHDTFTIHY